MPDRADSDDHHAASDKHQAASDKHQAASDKEQAAADEEQAASDKDQAASDKDQAASDEDQVASDEDQAADDREQAASDREQAAHVPGRNVAFETGFGRLHEDARVARQESTTGREDATQERAAAGSSERGRPAPRRACLLARSHRRGPRPRRRGPRPRHSRVRDGAEPRYRRSSREHRAEAASDRARAVEDRASAAEDRRQAAEERERLEAQLERAQLDDLTGFYLRGLGKAMLQREIDRSRRADGRMVLAYVDVDGLKQVNDTQGHDAGDRLLVNVAEAIRSRLRSYDPVVRMGGDEFVFVISESDLDATRSVVKAIRGALTDRQEDASITVGLAALEADDSLESLCARADAVLRKRKSA